MVKRLCFFEKGRQTQFLALFCLKTKSENNITILAKTMEKPLGEKHILRLS